MFVLHKSKPRNLIFCDNSIVYVFVSVYICFVYFRSRIHVLEEQVREVELKTQHTIQEERKKRRDLMVNSI